MNFIEEKTAKSKKICKRMYMYIYIEVIVAGILDYWHL